MSTPRSIGIIAGSGIYPETFVRAARKAEPNTRLVVVGFENETRPDLEAQVERSEEHTSELQSRP